MNVHSVYRVLESKGVGNKVVYAGGLDCLEGELNIRAEVTTWARE